MKKIFILTFATILLSGCTTPSLPTNKTEIDKANVIYGVDPETILDFSYQDLDKVEMAVFEKTKLQELNLSYNKLTGALPSQIGKLQSLKILRANNNQMTGVPAEIGQLKALEILDLSNNQLTGLPNELANLKNLKTLNLSGNAYSGQDLTVIRKSLPNVNYILK